MQTSSFQFLRELFPGRVNVSLQEAADSIGVAPKTLRNQLSAGQLGCRTHTVGSRRLVSIIDLAAFLDRLRGVEPAPTVSPPAEPATARRRGRPTKAEQMGRQVGEGRS